MVREIRAQIRGELAGKSSDEVIAFLKKAGSEARARASGVQARRKRGRSK
jgi:hypothetical protein